MTDRSIYEYDNSIYYDAMTLLCDTCLGSGISRTTYMYAMDKSKIVKVEKIGYFQNIQEMETWNQVKNYPEYRKWFAECFYMSLSGRVLIQEYCKQINKLPDRIPEILADCSIYNWGETLDGRIVICDYGIMSTLPSVIAKNKKPVLTGKDADSFDNNCLTMMDYYRAK